MEAQARVFLDTRRLLLGDDWDNKLAEAQKTAQISVILVSSNTERAYYQREEIAAAIDLARDDDAGHRVVPVYLDEAASSAHATPYGLRLKHGLRVSNTLAMADAAQKLLELLNQLRTGPTAATTAIAAPGDRKQADTGIIHQPPASWFSPVRSNTFRYKLVAFDFDGTLMRGHNFSFSWEAVWQGLAFSRRIQKQLRQEYRLRSEADPTRESRIRAYRDWCDKACEYFRKRGLTRAQLREFSNPLWLTINCRDAMDNLRRHGVVIAIISGGINTFLEDVFPDYSDYVDFVFMNEFEFAPTGALRGVRATAFDFLGKAEALELVCERVGCTPEEAIFVGDHFNDEEIMLRVNKAIAYPPQDRVVHDTSDELITEDNLLRILPHVLVE